MRRAADGKRLLLLARPGPVRIGLRALLSAFPGFEQLDPVAGGDVVRQAIAARQPGLIVIEAVTGGAEDLDLISWLKAVMPATRCILLVDSVERQELALAMGVDAAWLLGSRPDELAATVERLLARTNECPSRR